MADAGGDHGEAEFVGDGGDFTVADGAAGLNDGGGAGFRGFFHGIGEGEEFRPGAEAIRLWEVEIR